MKGSALAQFYIPGEDLMYEYIPAFHVSSLIGEWASTLTVDWYLFLLQFAEDVARFYDIYAAVEIGT